MLKNKIKNIFILVIIFVFGMVLEYFITIKIQETKSLSLMFSPGLKKKDDSGLIAPLLTSGSNKIELKEVDDYIKDSLQNLNVSSVSYYYFNFKNGERSSYNENEKYAPASLLKVPIMIAVYKMAEKDPNFLSKTIYYDGKIDLNQQENFKLFYLFLILVYKFISIDKSSNYKKCCDCVH
jgi:hypothetical protein